jgi:hypothetical protein
MVVAVIAMLTGFPIVVRATLMSSLAITMRMNAKKLKPCMAQNRYWDESGKQ